MKTYTVTGRAKSSVAFRQGDSLAANYVLDGRRLHLVLATRRKGANGEFMGDLQVTGYVEAESVDEAIAHITRGREMAAILSVATNSAIAPLEGELAYETTPGVEEREFFQRFVPEDDLSYADRVVPLDASCALLTAIAHHHERDRLVRAICQYAEALDHWENGNELLVVAHLFMGVEAIKKTAWRAEMASRNLTKEALAADWGFEEGGRLRVDEFLDRTARVRLVFQGDAEHHRIAKDVSDNFEHGFANSGKLWKPAASAIVPTAKYLRDAILRLSGMGTDERAVLEGDAFADPRGPAGLEQYFHGKLLAAPGAQLAPDGQEHPHCIWEIEVFARRSESGGHEYEHKPKMTAMIGPEVKLQPMKNEVYARGKFKPAAAGQVSGTSDGTNVEQTT